MYTLKVLINHPFLETFEKNVKKVGNFFIFHKKFKIIKKERILILEFAKVRGRVFERHLEMFSLC